MSSLLISSASSVRRRGTFARLTLSSLVALSLLAVRLSTCEPVCANPSRSDERKIGPRVIEALQQEGEVNVVVALRRPPVMKMERIDLPRLRREVGRLQRDVLFPLGGADFRVRHQYQAVPALSGTILSEAGLLKLASHAAVERIDLDVGGRGSLKDSVPLIGADAWHTEGVTGRGVVVAVLDSGLDTDHDDLATALIHQECFLDDDGSIDGNGLCPNDSDRQSGPGAAEDDAGHGTHVTGIIASRGNRSSVGVAPRTKIISIKVTAGPSFSGAFYYFSEIVAALDFIINNRPDVQIVNMSLVTNATFDGDCDDTTSWNMAGASAINTLRARGVIAFASSGNVGSGTDMSSPACLSNVLSVGATSDDDQVAGLTNSNASTDVMAPGIDIVSSGLSNGTATASGTSMASPHAAGCAALLLASGVAKTPDEIETHLESSLVRVTDETNGLTFPRIDCSFALLDGVTLSGPSIGLEDTDYIFTATASPLTAAEPITYVVQASAHAPLTSTGGLTSTFSFGWTTPGVQTITLTAQNVANAVSDIHVIVLFPIDEILYLPYIVK